MNLKPLVALLALSLPLAACGNKGPLVRPGAAAPAPAEAPAAPSTTTPPADALPPADSSTAPPPAGNG